MSGIQLGFCVPIETPQQLKLVGHRTRRWNDWDGGQVGGCPSWLLMPSRSQPKCHVCNNSAMIFVAQIYAPKDEEHSFHRSLYIFACPNDSQVTVWRINCPRDSPHWPYEGDEEDNNCIAEPSNKTTCVVCGFPASGICATQQLPFCGRIHQTLQFVKKKNEGGAPEAVTQGIFTPMYELVVEEEEKSPEEEEDGDIVAVGAGGDSDAFLEQADLNAAILGQERTTSRQDDIMYEKFRDRIEKDREQVLRYGGSPLWMTAQTPDEIPPCDHCGGKRSFEFQLMPQLLHYLNGSIPSTTSSDGDDALLSPDHLLKLNAIESEPSELDWGVVAVYTCKASCPSTLPVIEYAYVQESIAATQR